MASSSKAPTAGRGAPEEFVALDLVTRAVLARAEQADEWDAGARAAVLAGLAKHRDQIALVESRVLAAEREAGTWALKGDRDLASFAGRLSRQGRGAGFAAVGQAATLGAMPAVAEALAEGPVTTRHVAEITRHVGTSAALAAQLSTDEGQAAVVELARRLDGAEFGKELARMGAALDPAARQHSHDAQRAKRFLHLTHTPGGTLIKGQLDSVAGHKLARLVDTLSPRPALDDDRDRGQRQADALMVAVDRVLTERASTTGVLAPVQALITFDAPTWAAVRAGRRASGVGRPSAAGQSGEVEWSARAGRSTGNASPAGVGRSAEPAVQPSAGSAADLVAALRGVSPVVDDSGNAWPPSEIGRALCDCTLTRAVMGANGHPLDLGRDARLFTRAHWLALHASGQRTCAVAGCAMPLTYTELHHMSWWDRDGGPTSSANCAPECSFHHHEIHRLDIRVSRRADGTFEHRHPDGRRYGGAPPGGSVLGSTYEHEERAGLDGDPDAGTGTDALVGNGTHTGSGTVAGARVGMATDAASQREAYRLDLMPA